RSFGADFSGVQAYLGRGESMGALGAEAATRNEKMAFATDSPSKELVAHELAHVAQGRQHGANAGVHAKDAVSSPSHAAEGESDQVGSAAARGERVSVGAAPGGGLSLKGTCKLKGDFKDGKTGMLLEITTENVQTVEQLRNRTNGINAILFIDGKRKP